MFLLFAVDVVVCLVVVALAAHVAAFVFAVVSVVVVVVPCRPQLRKLQLSRTATSGAYAALNCKRILFFLCFSYF